MALSFYQQIMIAGFFVFGMTYYVSVPPNKLWNAIYVLVAHAIGHTLASLL